MLLSQFLSQCLGKSPNQVVFSFLGKDTKASDFISTVARFSYLFQKEIGCGKRVAYIGSNSPSMMAAFIALSNTRSLFIPIDPHVTDVALDEWIYSTKPTHVMVTNDFYPRVRDLFRRKGVTLPVIEIEKKRGGEYNASYVPPPDQTPKDTDPILLLRTAKTAGKYKDCVFTHLQLQAAIQGIKRLYHYGSADRVYTSFNWSHPFFFVHGVLFPVFAGAASVIDPGIEFSESLEFFSTNKVNRIVGTSDYFQKLVLICRSFERPLSGIKSVTVGLQAMSPQMAKILGLMKVKVSTCYGQTENLWSVCMSDTQEEDANFLPPMRALSGVQYKVVDKMGDAVEGDGAREGQLALSGPTVMSKYWVKDKDEEAKEMSQEVLRGTWLYTGDLFRLEGAGEYLKLTFLGRKDGLKPQFRGLDTFKPEMVEDAIRIQGGVQDVAAYRNTSTGKGPITVLVVKSPENEKTEHQMLEDALPALTPKNIPSKILSVAAIPRTEKGALDTDAVQEMLNPQKKSA